MFLGLSQLAIMFLGEATCIFIYLLMKVFRAKQLEEERELARRQGKIMEISFWYLVIPVLLDMGSSLLKFVSLFFLPASVYLMLGGTKILITAFYSKLFLGRIQTPNEWLGIVFSISGVVMAGVADVLFKSSVNFSDYQVIGIFLQVFSGFLSSGYLM